MDFGLFFVYANIIKAECDGCMKKHGKFIEKIKNNI